MWLDLAREYSERRHHQQHIREEVDAPGVSEPRFFAPVLATFVRTLPHISRAAAPGRTGVQVRIVGRSGGDRVLPREGE